MGSGFLSSISIKGRNNVTFVPLKQRPLVKFCKHAVRLILNVGRKNYDSIVKNYGSITKLKHGNLGKKMNKKHILELKADCKQ